MLYTERQQYLTAVRSVLQGAEEARVTLAKARQRLDGTGSAPSGQRR
jgi:hypothetical protein